MDKEFTCFFTGHRVIAPEKIEKVKELTEKTAVSLIEDKGVTDFIAGGALGFDTMAEEIILKLKEKYPYIKLHLYLPCFDQSRRWSYVQKYNWHMMLTKADDYIYVTEDDYTPDCMQKRNHKMADDSLYCIAFCILDKSGTGSTVHYAKDTGTVIYNIADEIYE